MKAVFVDTSYYVALFNRADRFHSKALRLATTIKVPRIVTEFVLLELGNLASVGKSRQVFVNLVRTLRSNPRAVVIPATSELFARGVTLFADRPDKNWSLTDCTSFVVMKDHGLNEALTTDHHFEQAGFTVLLI